MSVAAGLRGLRGFFLADPEDLSLLQLVDEFSPGGRAGPGTVYRIQGGNGALPGDRPPPEGVRLNTIVRRVRQDARGVRVTCASAGGRRELRADYFVAALPATTLRDVVFTPARRRCRRGHRVAEVRRRHPPAAPVRASLLAQGAAAARVRHRPADRRALG